MPVVPYEISFANRDYLRCIIPRIRVVKKCNNEGWMRKF